MELAHWLLLALTSLPPAYVDRDEAGRHERMATIAGAVEEVTQRATCTDRYADERCEPIWLGEPRQLGALIITKGWWESRFARNVHEGNCRKDECDATKIRGRIVHRARSPWQLQRTSFSEPEWDTMVGTGYEPTRSAAWAAAKVLSHGKKACRSNHGALAWYGAQNCRWKGAIPRYGTFQRLMRQSPHALRDER